MSGAAEVHLMEYDKLKDEQLERIRARDSMTYATLVVIAAIGSGVLQFHLPELLLALPPATVVTGWLRLLDDSKVTQLGRYFATDLSRALRETTGEQDVLAWESGWRTPRRRTRKIFTLGMDVLMHAGPALIATGCWWAFTHQHHPVYVVAAVIDLVLAALLTWQLIAHADLVGHPQNGQT
jgi:hypothetical protein